MLRSGKDGEWVVIAKEYRVSFRGDENVLKWTVVMVAYICDYIKKPLNYTLKHFLKISYDKP